MASLRPAFLQLRGRIQTLAPQWRQLRQSMPAFRIGPMHGSRRHMTTDRPNYGEDIEPVEGAHKLTKKELMKQKDLADRFLAVFAQVSEGRQTDSSPQDAMITVDNQTLRLNGQGRLVVTMPRHARVLPVSPSYFTRQSQFSDALVELQRLERRFGQLPVAPSDQLPRVAFRTLKDYKLMVGEGVKATDYNRAIDIAKRLYKIHPQLKPPEVDKAIEEFKRDIQDNTQDVKVIPVDRFGRTVGVGRRKTSVARAWLVEGTGEVLINGKPLSVAFGRVHDRETATWPLRATERMDKYNIWALVTGGGTTGQAEALTLAVAKALMGHEPALKPALRRAGCVTRDRRTVERKKAGHVKARKSPTWVKR